MTENAFPSPLWLQDGQDDFQFDAASPISNFDVLDKHVEDGNLRRPARSIHAINWVWDICDKIATHFAMKTEKVTLLAS